MISLAAREYPTPTGATYLYAIAEHCTAWLDEIGGVGENPVYFYSNGRIAAVVSDAPPGRIRPERRNLAAHQEVLRRLMERETVLPVSFGVVADTPIALERLLEINTDAFLEQLARVRGKVEWSLRVSWSVPNIFEFFVEAHAELREARDRLLATTPTQDDKIAVGRLFEELLRQDRARYTEQIENALRDTTAEMRPNALRSEQEILNLACLVERDRQPAFEAAIMQAAQALDEHYAFALSGPWAPHNFVEMTIAL
jgi:hypothetical protein